LRFLDFIPRIDTALTVLLTKCIVGGCGVPDSGFIQYDIQIRLESKQLNEIDFLNIGVFMSPCPSRSLQLVRNVCPLLQTLENPRVRRYKAMAGDNMHSITCS